MTSWRALAIFLLWAYKLVSNWGFRYSGMWHCHRVSDWGFIYSGMWYCHRMSGSWCFGESWCHHLKGQEVQEDCFWTSWPWRWRLCVSLKHWQAFTLHHSTILQETELSAAPLLEPPVILLSVSAYAELLNASVYCESTCRADRTVRLILWEHT